MSNGSAGKETPPMVSEMAENLIGSEIIKLAGQVNSRIAQGEKIYNYTIGDFNPEVFPIPQELEDYVVEAYRNKQTNYPAANGILPLREAVAAFLNRGAGLDYQPDNILISGGGRPLIYACYQAVVDPGDKVIFPVPSWNNNHYTHLTRGVAIEIETTPENNFMPRAADIEPHIEDAALIALCSPLNPTGTTFPENALLEICELVLKENKRREGNRKPVYILYDQLYWTLTHGKTVHSHPVGVCPEIKDYTIYIDGLSKAFAATGVRVGWSVGPDMLIGKMRSFLSHVGAWSPKPEQVATAKFLNNQSAVDNYLTSFKKSIQDRLNGFYTHFQFLKASGYPIDCIAPQAAIYLTVKIDLIGAKKSDGSVIDSVQSTTSFLLNEASIAMVPFYAFGASKDSKWYRLSVGTCTIEDMHHSMEKLSSALKTLSF